MPDNIRILAEGHRAVDFLLAVYAIPSCTLFVLDAQHHRKIKQKEFS